MECNDDVGGEKNELVEEERVTEEGDTGDGMGGEEGELKKSMDGEAKEVTEDVKGDDTEGDVVAELPHKNQQAEKEEKVTSAAAVAEKTGGKVGLEEVEVILLFSLTVSELMLAIFTILIPSLILE